MSDVLSEPLYVQALERFLDISRLLNEVESIYLDTHPTMKYCWNTDEVENNNGIILDRDHKPEEKFIYDTSELTEENMWLKDILLSESSDSSDEEEMTYAEMKKMIRRHKAMKKIRDKASQKPDSYVGYSTSILVGGDQKMNFNSPSLDYSNKTRRHKRGAKVKPRKRENNPLTICDMIDALTYDYVQNGKTDTKKEGNVLPPSKRHKTSHQSVRTFKDIWKETSRQIVNFNNRRLKFLETVKSKRKTICTSVKERAAKLALKRHESSSLVVVNPDRAPLSETVKVDIETEDLKGSAIVKLEMEDNVVKGAGETKEVEFKSEQEVECKVNSEVESKSEQVVKCKVDPDVVCKVGPEIECKDYHKSEGKEVKPKKEDKESEEVVKPVKEDVIQDEKGVVKSETTNSESSHTETKPPSGSGESSVTPATGSLIAGVKQEVEERSAKGKTDVNISTTVAESSTDTEVKSESEPKTKVNVKSEFKKCEEKG